jgi:putative nucleotidyltransferase with HDIG domain
MTWPIRLYSGAIIAGAAAFAAALDWPALLRLDTSDYAGLLVFITLAALSQYMGVDSGTGHRVRSSVAFLPLLALILLFPVAAVVVAVFVTALVNDFGSGRAFRTRLLNLAQLVIAYGTAALLFVILRGVPAGVALGEDVGSFLTIFAPFYAAVILFFSINILVVSAYLAIRDGQPVLGVIGENLGRGGGNFMYDLLASPIALLAAYLYWKLHVAGLLVVIAPLLLIRYSYLSALQLERANRDLLRVLIKAIETRDPYTSGHSLRVSNLARMIAEDHGFRPSVATRIETAALLHDIGKIDAAFADIIAKKSSLSEDERAVIKTHATRGADLLQSLTSLERDVIEGVRHHHEQYDGSGYPDGLVGKAIPVAARIIMLCDSVDAMLSDRPYRAALPINEVKKELLRCSGTQFDPDLIRTILDNGTLERAELLVDRTGARTRPKAELAIV